MIYYKNDGKLSKRQANRSWNQPLLIHLGLVDNGRSAPLAAGACVSAGDLIVARENDHRLVTDPGHTLANGDRFVVDVVTGEGRPRDW